MDKLQDNIINEIRNKTDIVEIISSYIPLVPRGKNYFGVCPFHDDNHPSMSVSPEKQVFKCFSCGAAGNVFKFVMDYENINFIDAVKLLGDKCGIEINAKTNYKKINKNEKLYEIYSLASKFYQNNINTSEGKKAKEYLKNRNIDENIIKEFEIGLALKNNKMLSNLLKNKNYDNKYLDKSSLLIKNGLDYKDKYYNRIMFPLYDLEGKVVGFSGRIYDSVDEAKYINTSETEIFKKGELIYNYHRAKIEARKKGYVIVVEGFMDVIRCYTIGIYNVVAMMGTAVTKKQANLLKRLAKEIILCFDGDDAGEKATYSCSNELLEIGVTPKIVRLENKLDPDEYIIKNGKDLFEEKINNPISVMDFKLKYLKKDTNLKDAESTSNYLHRMIEEILKIEDPILERLTINKLVEETHIDINILTDEIKSKKNIKPEIKEQKTKKVIEDKYIKAQKYLLYYMINSKDALKIYIRKKPFFPNNIYRSLALEIIELYEKNGNVNVADLFTKIIDKKELNEALSNILEINLKEKPSIDELEDYVKVINEYNINYEIERLQNKMKEESLPSKKAEIAMEIIKLKKGA